MKIHQDSNATQTGEVVLMRPPRSAWFNMHAWKKLCDAITQSGATVVEANGTSSPGSSREPMFVRDPGIMIADAEMDAYPRYVLPLHKNTRKNGGHATRSDTFASALWKEGTVASETIAQFVQQHEGRASEGPLYIKGTLEGGNVVQDPLRKKLFVGINFANYMRDHGHAPNEQERNRYKASFDLAVTNLQEVLRRPEYVLPDGTHYEVVPLTMSDETAQKFYHLDGAFACLPSGQVLWCRELFTKEAQLQVERHIGREHLIAVSSDDAAKGALNFITVGDAIITPHAPAALKERFEGMGYTVTTPKDMGLHEDAWMFKKMGAVRCATLKITPDLGYPAHRGVAAAHARVSVLEDGGRA